MRFFGLLAVFATILAVLFRRAIAGGMRAFIFPVLTHKTNPTFWQVASAIIVKLKIQLVKDEMSFRFQVVTGAH
jgi:hypothetical protein